MQDRLLSQLLQSWWVVLFLLICLFAFEWRQKEERHTYQKLKTELTTLEKQLENEKTLESELNLQLRSLEDPDWIEQNLIRSLGVIPEGVQKARFLSTND